MDIFYMYCDECGHEYEIEADYTGILLADGHEPAAVDPSGFIFMTGHKPGCDAALIVPVDDNGAVVAA